jgi:hypothetical protein
MHSFARVGSAFLLGAALAHAQSSSAGSSISLAAAAQTASANSQAGVPLFPNEQVQLTEEVVTNLTTQLNKTTAALFVFGNSSDAVSSISSRTTGGCKVFPGDESWPIPLIWDILDLLLGDALIKTVPLASPCFNSWGDQNSAQCSFLQGQWTNSNLQ